MRTAIATVCLSGALNEKLEAIAAAKFKGVELFENDLLSFNGTAADVRRIAADLGLQIITFQPFRDFEGLPPEILQRKRRALMRYASQLEPLGPAPEDGPVLPCGFLGHFTERRELLWPGR